jgi:hypothetical protein
MTTRKLPSWLRWSYTAFMAVMVPVYLYMYGPTNFLYFCDTCLVIGFIAVWTESPLLASIPAVGIIGPQTLWAISFFAEFLHVKVPLFSGLTEYMFDSSVSLWLRGLSLYHLWLPFVAGFMVWKLGYHKHSFWWWWAICWTLLFICYFTTSPPPAPPGSLTPVNIDFIYGFGSTAIDTTIPIINKTLTVNQWFVGLLFGVPLVTALPVHLLLSRFFKLDSEKIG